MRSPPLRAADAFLKVYTLIDPNKAESIERTKIIKKSLNPVWNERLWVLVQVRPVQERTATCRGARRCNSTAGCARCGAIAVRAPALCRAVALPPCRASLVLQEPTTQALYVECFDRDYLNAKVCGWSV